MHLGIAGEVRCVITKADGTIKIDTGYQKNLILNQGLDFFGGNHGSSINTSCAIGSGNSTPTITQTKLDAFITLVSFSEATSDYSYADEGDGLYKMWDQRKYRFTGLDNVNISEVGLVSTGTTSENYYLTTRALIKDSAGAPTSISVKTGETLDIYYKIYKVIDVSDKTFVINMLNGNGDTLPYNVTVRPSQVGVGSNNNIASPIETEDKAGYTYYAVSDADLVSITSALPSTVRIASSAGSLSPYAENSFKRVFTLNLDLNDGNFSNGFRSIGVTAWFSGKPVPFKFLPFQIRFGSVADDSPIVKTNKDTLSIPLEFSWGRFEGEL